MEPLKTFAEAAPLVGMGESTLRKLVAARKVPFTRPIGTSNVRFSDDDIAEIRALSRVAPEKPLSPVAEMAARRASSRTAPRRSRSVA